MHIVVCGSGNSSIENLRQLETSDFRWGVEVEWFSCLIEVVSETKGIVKEVSSWDLLNDIVGELPLPIESILLKKITPVGATLVNMSIDCLLIMNKGN